MAQNAPGQHYRKGITIMELLQMFPDDKTAEEWFVKQRWTSGIRCAYCDSDNVNDSAKHPTMPYRCRACGKHFSVKSNSVMHSSKLSYQKWAIAIYLMSTNIKGISSMKLHRELGIRQATAWHLSLKQN
ncbi:MAG: transposase [Chloroflexi bacterium]|nr:transposase [Chloroflexota bacterium]